MSLTSTFYNCLLNPLMRGILRSPLHGIASKNIAILHFTGRKTGQARNTPLSYVREGDKILFLSSTNTNWWKNFRGEDRAVEVEIAGERLSGTASLLEGDSESLREGVRQFLTALPRDAMVYGIKLGKDKTPVEDSLVAAAPKLVLLKVVVD